MALTELEQARWNLYTFETATYGLVFDRSRAVRSAIRLCANVLADSENRHYASIRGYYSDSVAYLSLFLAGLIDTDEGN